MDDKIKLTPEQLAGLQGFLQKNDITANMTVKREYNFKGENAKVFKRAKEFFNPIVLTTVCVDASMRTVIK